MDYDLQIAKDPFEEINDADLAKAHIKLRSVQIKEKIYKSICRGNHNLNWLVDRYSDDLFPPETIKKFIAEMREKIMAEHGQFDPQMEVLTYLSTNAELKRTIFDMIDTITGTGQTKTMVELIRTIITLDSQRMDFIKFAGLSVKKGHHELMDHGIDTDIGSFEVLMNEADDIEVGLEKQETGLPRAIEGKVEEK